MSESLSEESQAHFHQLMVILQKITEKEIFFEGSFKRQTSMQIKRPLSCGAQAPKQPRLSTIRQKGT